MVGSLSGLSLPDNALSRVEAYTFASAADEFPGVGTQMKAEHFAAEMDFVAQIGSLSFSQTLPGSRDYTVLHGETDPPEWHGAMYMLERSQIGQGHLMKEMLLPALRQGSFGHDSNFWNDYCQGENQIARHIVE